MTTLPVGMKIKGKCRKWGLKKSMQGHLPEDVIWRKKTGFGAPIQAWLNGELKPLVDELLSESALKSQGIFNPTAIKRLLSDEAEKKDYFANHIWQILTYQIWHQEFVTTKSRMAA